MIQVGDIVNVDYLTIKIVKLLGRGKGGYSYLGVCEKGEFVVKQIHHEPCSYYNFGDKIQSELNDYKRLFAVGVRMPAMICYDTDKEIIVKEYVEGRVLSDLIKQNQNIDLYLQQMRAMLAPIYKAGLNIDYYPTNFVVNDRDNLIYYIDYECNLYDEKWDFDNWGIKYWKGEKPID